MTTPDLPEELGRPGATSSFSRPKGDRRENAESVGADTGSPSVHDLIVAYQRKDIRKYQELKREFIADNGAVQDEYIAVETQSGVYLTDRKGRFPPWRHSYRIKAYYARALDPSLDDAVRRTRFEESRWRPVLGGRSEEIVLTQLFSLLASLFRVQDLERETPDDDQRKMISVTAKAVKDYLPVLQRFAAGLARRATLQAYFFGMMVGVAVTATVIWILSVPVQVTLGTVPLSLIGNCAAAGGVGAVISVMVRVTNNDTLDIDYERGRVIAFLVGVFRPIIGAVFGGILLVFLKCGLIAITIAPATLQDITLFYVAVGFLAGFSERWAQDTIVSSAPALRARAPRESDETTHRGDGEGPPSVGHRRGTASADEAP